MKKLTVFLATLLFIVTTSDLWAQTQTVVAAVNEVGVPILQVSEVTLRTAFEDDCDADTASNFHGATFSAVQVVNRSGVYYLVGFGSNPNYPVIERAVQMTNTGGNLTLTVTSGTLARGTCAGCTGCSASGGGCTGCADPQDPGSCEYKTGGGHYGGLSNLGTFY